MKYCFGVDIGGTTVKMGLFEKDGKILDKWEIITKTEEEGKAVLPDIATSVLEKININQLKKEDIIGIGVGVPAPVSEKGVVNGSANIGWGYKDVKGELEVLTELPVAVGNDANVAALGEMWQGGGEGQSNIIMVTLGTGVGGGVIIGGSVVVGAHGAGGEIGHLCVNYEETETCGCGNRGGAHGAGGEIGHLCVNYEETETCGCGNRGCLEQYASATGIVRLAKKRLAEETRKTGLNSETVTAKDVFDAVKDGDVVAQEIAVEFGRYLGHGLANLAVVADPAVIVIGGGVSKAGDVLIPYIQKPFLERAFFANRNVDGLANLAVVADPAVIVIGGGVSKAGDVLIPYIQKPFLERAFFANRNVEFKLATLGNDAGICGSAKLILDKMN